MRTYAGELDDARLVRLVQAGEPDAFTELFRRHHPSVRRACARRMGTSDEADEIAQAAFVRAYERIDQCRGDARFGAWVEVIAQRMCADAWRARRRVVPVDDVRAEEWSPVEGGEDALLRAEQAIEVRRALATLPPRQREVVVARDVAGRRPGEIAAALALSIGAVDSLLLRARRRLALAFTTGTEAGATTTSLNAAAAVSSAVTTAGQRLHLLGRLTDFVFPVASNPAAAAAVPRLGPRVAGLAAAAGLLFAPASDTGAPANNPTTSGLRPPAVAVTAVVPLPPATPLPQAPSLPAPALSADGLANDGPPPPPHLAVGGGGAGDTPLPGPAVAGGLGQVVVTAVGSPALPADAADAVEGLASSVVGATAGVSEVIGAVTEAVPTAVDLVDLDQEQA